MIWLKNNIVILFVFFFTAVVLVLALRAQLGNPNESTMSNQSYVQNGPLEVSHERAYFALAYSIVERKSLQLSVTLAQFSTPDIAYENGKYVSLFAPGVPLIIIPAYIIGKIFGMSQLAVTLVIAIVSLFDAILIYRLARLFTVSKTASATGSLVYLFATPTFVYSVSLYQHQLTVLCMLLGIHIVLKHKSWWGVGLIWLLTGVSMVIDSPNLLLMSPLVIFASMRWLSWGKTLQGYMLRINIKSVLASITILFPAILLISYNVASIGQPFTLSGSLPSVDNISSSGKPVSLLTIDGKKINVFTRPDLMAKAPSLNTFFSPRNMLKGVYVDLLSNQRGVLFFAPVLFLAIIGFVFLYKKYPEQSLVLITLIITNIILYTMWGDPWGGWAFGARYLIPAYSLLAIGIAAAIHQLRSSKVFIVLFIILMVYSVFISTAGALTTNKIPPKSEALALQKQYHTAYKYTYAVNFDQLNAGKTLSFVYNTYAYPFVSLQIYYWIVSGSICVLITGLTIFESLNKKQEAFL